MSILVTGSTGQLGFDVALELKNRNTDYLAPTRDELDITNSINVKNYFLSKKPTGVIHCAAWTAVDLAEDNVNECRKANVDATSFIVEECKKLNIPLIYISTDYVFNGQGLKPWQTDDSTNPINAYGLSKRDGEYIVKKYDKHFIVRISWVFGINGKNFVKTMLSLSNKMSTIKVVSDQYGSPTYTKDLAPLLCDMINTTKYGIYHAHNEGICTWQEFATKIFQFANIPMEVIPIKTEDYPVKATRPKNSRLDTSSLSDNGFKLLPSWEDATKRYLIELKNNQAIN